MRSFTFWLITALAIGATLGSLIRPGIPEIAIVWGVAVALNYGWRSARRKHSLVGAS